MVQAMPSTTLTKLSKIRYLVTNISEVSGLTPLFVLSFKMYSEPTVVGLFPKLSGTPEIRAEVQDRDLSISPALTMMLVKCLP